MANSDEPAGDAAELRSDQSGAPAPDAFESRSPQATRQILHELRVHQIELEMQNEELRRAQAELQAARSQYVDLYDLAPIGYCTVDAHGLVLQANLAAAALLGVAREALVKQPISRFIFKADQDAYYLCRKQVLTSAQAQSCDLRLVQRDGAPLWVRLAATAVHDAGGSEVMRVVLSDINDRKLMEAAMQESEERYRALVDWSPEAIAVYRHGKVLYANPAAVKLFGARSAHALVGQPMLDRVQQDFRPVVLARAQGMRNSNASAPLIEIVMLRLDGTAMDVEVQSLRTVYAGEAAIQVAMHDISERARLARELRSRNIELESARSMAERANRAKSEFLSRMSHELRTPLSAILGFTQLLDGATPAPTAAQKRSIDEILKAGWYLLGLINEILDLEMVESGSVSLSMEALALAEILQESQVMLAPLAQERDVSVRFDRLGVSHFVHADRRRLKQVLINLLSNAIKYNKVGGAVLVDCASSTPGRIRVRVADTGQGLAADKLAQLFQPFNRLGQEAQGTQGTGIGLVVSKRLVEMMDGAMGAESTPGAGSVFWVELRLAAEPQSAAGVGAQATPPPRLEQPGAPVRTVLHVDDNPANRLLVEELVARRPEIRLLSAIDGSQGLEMANTWLPELILMDIHLPDITGVEVMKILRAQSSTAHIPIVALSANAMAHDIEAGLKAGFIDYLTKPIQIQHFMDVLDRALQFSHRPPGPTGDQVQS